MGNVFVILGWLSNLYKELFLSFSKWEQSVWLRAWAMFVIISLDQTKWKGSPVMDGRPDFQPKMDAKF